MKRFNKVMLLLLLSGLLFGCSLAKQDEKSNTGKIKDPDPVNDLFVGYWLTFDYVTTEDFNLTNDLLLMAHHVKVGQQSYNEYIRTDGILGRELQLYDNTIENLGDGSINRRRGTIQEADIILKKQSNVLLHSYPVYRDRITQEHFLGELNSYSIHLFDASISFSTKQSRIENQITEEMEVKVHVKMVDELQYVEVIQYSKLHEELERLKITKDEPYKLHVLEQTDYLIINEVYRNEDGQYTKRTLFNRDRYKPTEQFILNFTQSKNFVIGNRIEIHWRELL